MFPYRTKNPPERFPYITLWLIAVNALLFGLTYDSVLPFSQSLRSAMQMNASSSSILSAFTSLFVHDNIVFLAISMWLLWVFGPSVEGRLGPLKYLLLYFASGIAGNVTRLALFSSHALGATSAAMGVAAAFMYMFPFAQIAVFNPRRYLSFDDSFGDWQAQWVVLYFVGFDALAGVAARTSGRLADLAGLVVGLLIVLVLRPARDSENYANAQAMQSDTADYNNLGLIQLESLMQRPAGNADLVLAYIRKASAEGTDNDRARAREALVTYSSLLLEHGDATKVGELIARLTPDPGTLAPVTLLHLATRLEACGANRPALQILQYIYNCDPQCADSEAALLRIGRLFERSFGDLRQARLAYNELLKRFPRGELAVDAQDCIRRLSPS